MKLSPPRQMERLVAAILRRSSAKAWSPRRLRRELRKRGAQACARLSRSRSTWYRAVRAVAGCGVLAIPDTRQQELFGRTP